MRMSEKEKRRGFIEQLLKDDDFRFWKDKGEGGRSWCLPTDKCPKCKTNLEFRGKEKKTSRFGYYRYGLFCPKCGEITCVSEGKSYIIRKSHIGRMLGRHAGDIGEKFAHKILTDAGYEIRSFAELSSDVLCKDENFKSHEILYRGIAKMFLGNKYQDFIEFCEAWNRDLKVPSTIRGVRPHGTETFSPTGVGFDFVGMKDDKFYLIEVKTNRAVLQKFQKKMLLKAKDFGFIPLIVRVKVEVRVPLEEVRIEEL